jgi:hypothetical protein
MEMKKRIGLAIVVVALLVGLSDAFAERPRTRTDQNARLFRDNAWRLHEGTRKAPDPRGDWFDALRQGRRD